MLTLRPMVDADLPLVEGWLDRPHVARWWGADELAAMGRCLAGKDPGTHLVVAEVDGRPIGWAQWYRWDDEPAEAAAMRARPDEIGLDYAIGEPDAVGSGHGRRLIAALVDHVRGRVPGAGFLVGPDAANAASRAVLERNGFVLVAVRPVVTEPTDDPIAIYRLDL